MNQVPKANSIMRQLYEALLSLPVGGSFLFERNNKKPYDAAKRAGVKIRTRKEDGLGWRITRIA